MDKKSGRKSIKDNLEKIKKHLGEDYEKIKYTNALIVNIQITEDIKNKLKSYENKKLMVEKIIEKNIDNVLEMEEIKTKKEYKFTKRLWIQLTLDTVDKLIIAMESEGDIGKNRILNGILDNYFSNLNKQEGE